MFGPVLSHTQLIILSTLAIRDGSLRVFVLILFYIYVLMLAN